MLIDGSLELLDDEEAWRLVGCCGVGRVGVSIGALPAIFPVSYAVVDRSVVFRTAPGTKLSAALAGAIVAFQVDAHEPARRDGWSVLMIGPSVVDVDPVTLLLATAAGLDPLAGGDRPNVVRIRPELVSGRRIVHDTTS